MTDQLNEIIEMIKQKYHCHTIIVYGSHARNAATATSDYDIVAIRDHGELERDCRLYGEAYLDVFIYSDEHIKNPDVSFIRIKDGIVICQKNKIGDELLARVNEIFNNGPTPTPAWEKHEINNWLMKMFTRATQNDIEANFRRHWLLHDSLECYFKLRDQWYLGPKESFAWLKQNDLETYDAFVAALRPHTDFAAIERLVNRIRV